MPIPLVSALVPAAVTVSSKLFFILLSIAAFKVGLKLLAFAGFGLASIIGIDGFTQTIFGFIDQHVSGLPATVLQLLYLSQVDSAMTIMISAHVAAMGVRIAGGFTKPIFTPVGA